MHNAEIVEKNVISTSSGRLAIVHALKFSREDYNSGKMPRLTLPKRAGIQGLVFRFRQAEHDEAVLAIRDNSRVEGSAYRTPCQLATRINNYSGSHHPRCLLLPKHCIKLYILALFSYVR